MNPHLAGSRPKTKRIYRQKVQGAKVGAQLPVCSYLTWYKRTCHIHNEWVKPEARRCCHHESDNSYEGENKVHCVILDTQS
ncbi:hypothetical protein [Endozoicomonas euniceicola]|uniref:Uncharacterized protein n=1 Tax=Endozoicomonas euniceicola TaxID=1234143 RepID=A0ABY6GZU5_9GAMM|nr:hypothetical protein [Endozoicomonas euniceicola]UYM17536.1 hypothetical protein NX720_06365 [Endozoicomonas euniceicola]